MGSKFYRSTISLFWPLCRSLTLAAEIQDENVENKTSWENPSHEKGALDASEQWEIRSYSAFWESEATSTKMTITSQDDFSTSSSCSERRFLSPIFWARSGFYTLGMFPVITSSFNTSRLNWMVNERHLDRNNSTNGRGSEWHWGEHGFVTNEGNGFNSSGIHF